MSDELAVASQAPTDAEIGVVVRRLAAAYEGNLRWRMRELKETAEEADRKRRRDLLETDQARKCLDVGR